MKYTLLLAGGALLASSLLAQYAPAPPPMPDSPPPNGYPQSSPAKPYASPASYSPAPGYAPAANYILAPAQLDQLLSPIALYPDPLLGVMLPASTHPDQIAVAAGFGSANVDPVQIDQQPWDDSVKVLAHYPNVAAWMAQNADWTDALGGAVAAQEQDVMDSIQRLRANARASGALVDTPQQRVLVDASNTISILPAQPETIYVPVYDPQYVVTAPPPGVRFSINFGSPYHVGVGPEYDLDRRRHSVWIDRTRDNRRDLSHASNANFHDRQQWQPARATRPGIEVTRSAPPSRQVPRPRTYDYRTGNQHASPSPTGRASSPAVEWSGTPPHGDRNRGVQSQGNASSISQHPATNDARGPRDREQSDRTDDRRRGDDRDGR